MLPLVSIITTAVIGTGLFSKTLIVCGLRVVEDLEVLEDEVRDEPLLGVGDGDVDRHRLGRDLDLLLLARARAGQGHAMRTAAMRRMGIPE